MPSKLYIKRLELSGFKSFVKRTAFAFQPGLAGIVGPNGCGKSNIIDAVRWVLGEQSPRALRGAKMEELIFHGSEKEKAVGMAEVSMTLDNDEGVLAKQGPEVSVTRRLYRSGESEYLINKSPCRLKDITDLILDTGVSTSEYVIMEQGKIDAVILARPTERMALFEEASGVRRYQMQKEETERKLEATQQNLVRVADIVHELKRQLDSLERQAKHAEQYQEMRKRARELKARARAVELARGRAQLDEAEGALAACRASLDAARARLVERAEGVRAARERAEASDRAARELDRELAALRDAQGEAGRRLEALRLALTQFAVQQQEREGRLADALASGEKVAARVARTQEEEQHDQAELDRARAELVRVERWVKDLEGLLEESRNALAARRRELGTQADRLHQGAPTEGGDAGPAAGPLAEFREQAPSVEWPLARLFQTEERWQPAIVAALGALADAAVVETWAHAHALLAAWRAQREAPLAIVVLEAVGEPGERGPLPEGAIGWADEKITVAPKFAVLARALLGNVALSEAESAAAAAGGGTLALASGVRLSPPGVVWWPGRRLGGATAGGPELAMLLAAAVRELGEIEGRIVEIEADLSEARRKESEARVEVARVDQRLHGHRGERATLEQTAEESAALIARLRSELEGLRGERQRAEDALREREEAWAAERRRQDELAGRLYAAQDEAAARREGAAQAEREAEEARGEVDGLSEQIVGREGVYHEAKAQYERVQHEFTNEFGAEAGRLDELATQALTPEESAQLARLEARLDEMGEGVNLMALEEFGELQARYAEYLKQIEDLRRSRESLTRAIQRLDRESERRFEQTFETIRKNFHTMFRRLFGGGEADLKLVESEEGERGVEVEAKPPGKRNQTIALLSGGERALVSTSLLFALYMTKPSPFCFLDELDAPLDDANTDRFMKMLKEFSAQTQFIAITHNKHTMEMVETLYGITMEEPGVSKVVSVRMKSHEAAAPAPAPA